MTQRKPSQPPNKAEVPLVRSSVAEYLTFDAASGQDDVEAIYADESIWLTQKMLGQLYDENVRPVNEHLKKLGRQRVAGRLSCPEIPDNCLRWQDVQHRALQAARQRSVCDNMLFEHMRLNMAMTDES